MILKYIIGGIGFLLIPFPVAGVIALLRIPKKGKKGKVYPSKLVAFIGLITAVPFLFLTVITALTDQPLWVPILFFAFSLLGASLVIAFIFRRIDYDEEGFTAKKLLGIKRRYSYSEVTAIKLNMHEMYIYLGKRRVMIDEFDIGGLDFVKLVIRKYKTLHDGEEIPAAEKKNDIFNGHVHDSSALIFVYILITIFILAFGACMVWYVFFTPSNADNTTEQQVTFRSYDKHDEEIVMISADNTIYKISFTDGKFDPPAVRMICDGKTAVTVYSKQYTPKDKESYYDIKAIVYDGTYLLSFDETNGMFRREYSPLILFAVILAILWGAVFAGTIIIGRNPDKFSPKIARLFFKDGYIR